MNREILFRSKRVDNDEWVYGFLVKMWGQYHIIDQNDENSAYMIKPKTVGQFTGLCDKNGKKIFDGDIVESPNGTQGFIEWQNAECAFLVNIGDDWQTMDDCPYEVVGNIYDKGEEEGNKSER